MGVEDVGEQFLSSFFGELLSYSEGGNDFAVRSHLSQPSHYVSISQPNPGLILDILRRPLVQNLQQSGLFAFVLGLPANQSFQSFIGDRLQR